MAVAVEIRGIAGVGMGMLLLGGGFVSGGGILSVMMGFHGC